MLRPRPDALMSLTLNKTVFKLRQSLKAHLSIATIDSGMTRLVMPQSSNADSPIEAELLSKVTHSKSSQRENASSPMVVTDDGIVIVATVLHLKARGNRGDCIGDDSAFATDNQ